MEGVVIQNERLRVEISLLGAEILRIQDAEGIDRLWDGDPAFWKGRSPVLFPLCGALKDDTYTLAGKPYHLMKHGFASASVFAVEQLEEAGVTLLLAGDARAFPGLPSAFAFRVRYALEGSALRVAFEAENLGDAAFYFSCGAHEAYACPEGIEAYRVVLERPETLDRCVLEGSFLSGETEPVPMEPGVLPLHAGLFSNDSLVLASLGSRAVTLESTAHARTVRVEFADFPYLLLWTVPGAGFLCIEPWHNLPDALDTDQRIEHKPGMIRLEPGETRTLTHTVHFA